MPANLPNPTTYAEINLLMHRLSSNVKSVLGDAFYGLYLCGSLASGDFDLHRSDVDFLVVTCGNLSREQISKLEAMHHNLAISSVPWVEKLEGVYMPKEMLRRYLPDDPPIPQVNEGRFYLEHQGIDWVLQRYSIRENELVVTGPSLRDFIDPVTSEQLRQAVLELLRTWWAAMLRDSTRLENDEYQAYAVLSMCRALCTVQKGALLSKQASAQWALDTLGSEWAPLIKKAMQWRRGLPMEKMKETKSFIRYTIKRSSQMV